MVTREGAVLLIFWALAGQADARGAGTYGGLDLLGSARETALAGSFRAVGGDAFAPLANPSQGARNMGFSAAFSHLSWLADTDADALILGLPLGGWGRIHIFGGQVSYPELELRDASGVLQGKTAPKAQMAGLAWGEALTKSWSLGLQARFLQQDLILDQPKGFGAGLGTGWRAPGGGISAGLSLGLRSGQGQSEPRWDVEAGMAAAFWTGPSHDLRLATDLQSFGGQLRLGSGVEARVLKRILAMRAGYSLEPGGAYTNRSGGLAFGFGLQVNALSLDYGVRSLGAFGWTQHVALSWSPEPALPLAGKAVEVSTRPAATLQPGMAGSTTLGGSALEPRAGPVSAATKTQRLLIVNEFVVKGEHLERQGNWDQALTAYLQAVKENANDSLAWKRLAQAYLQIGRKDYALTCVERLSQLDPEDQDLPALRAASK